MEYFPTEEIFLNLFINPNGMETKETIAQRFTEVRKELGMTQSEFAAALGIPNTTADIERGRTRVSGWVVSELLRKFQINPLWLFGWSEEKFGMGSQVDTLPKVVTVDPADRENIVLVNAKAAAGYPQNLADTSWFQSLPAFDLPIPEFRNATYRGFQVEGESMLPALYPGDWVLARSVEKLDYVSAGKMYVVVMEDSIMVKKIEKPERSNNIRLVSINEDYAPYEIKAYQIQELWEVSSRITFQMEMKSEKGLLKELKESMESLKEQLGGKPKGA